MKTNFKTTGWSKMIAFLLCFVMLFQISSAFAIEEDVPTEFVNAVIDTVTETEEEIQTEPADKTVDVFMDMAEKDELSEDVSDFTYNVIPDTELIPAEELPVGEIVSNTIAAEQTVVIDENQEWLDIGLILNENGHLVFPTPERTDIGSEWHISVLDDYTDKMKDRTVYSAISAAAQDAYNFIVNTESVSMEYSAILQRMGELILRCFDDSVNDDETKNLVIELESLYQELFNLRNQTCIDGIYVFAGSDIQVDLPWESYTGHSVLDLDIFDAYDVCNGLAVLPEFVVHRSDEKKIEALNLVTSASDAVSGMRSILGAYQNAIERLIIAADTCDENLMAHNKQAGDLYSIGNETDRWRDTDSEYIISSSLDNLSDTVAYLQLNEGVLVNIHDSVQRMDWLVTELLNDSNLSTFAIIDECNALCEMIDYFAVFASYEGHHGLYWDEGNMIFPCGWQDLCHHEIVITNRQMSCSALGISQDMPMSVDTLNRFDEAVHRLSIFRSYLGSWQNGCEHIRNLCFNILENGPLIGNKFGIDEVTNHHTLDVLTGDFEEEITAINARIAELEVRKGSDTNDEISIQCIQQEIDRYPEIIDLMVDLIQTRTSNINKVSINGSEWGFYGAVTAYEEPYQYKLTYFSNLSPTTDVCVIDYIEDNDSSVYAGVVTGIDLSEAEATGVPVQVFAILYDEATVVTAESALPDILPDGAWQKIDPATFSDWHSVQALAFYFGDTVFGPEIGPLCQLSSLSVTVNMMSKYGAKPGSSVVPMPEGGYELTNTCYTRERIGDSNQIEQHQAVSYTLVNQNSGVPTGTLRISKTVQKGEINCHVNIIWDDEGFESERPLFVTIDLLRDNRIFDSIKTDAASGWYCDWTGLDNRYAWSIEPREVVPYEVTVRNQGNNGFSVVFTYVASEGPDDPLPLDEFTILWYDEDESTVLAGPVTVSKGMKEPLFPQPLPTKAEDEDFTYEFSGWQRKEDSVGNVSYIAKYTATPKYSSATQVQYMLK